VGFDATWRCTRRFPTPRETRSAPFSGTSPGAEVDETDTYSLANDPSHPSVVDVELDSWVVLRVSAFTHDDDAWPTAGNHENDLGGAQTTIDPGAPTTLGAITVRPTRTDNDNAGYIVSLQATIVPDPKPATLRLQFEDLLLYEDEEWGSTHMAIYVHAQAPARNGALALNREIFRWNNANGDVDEVNSYQLNNGPVSSVVQLPVTGPTDIWVEGYADDDQDWPWGGSNENALGTAVVTVDPADPEAVGVDSSDEHAVESVEDRMTHPLRGTLFDAALSEAAARSVNVNATIESGSAPS
jgi:hypothetical protein